MEQSSATPAHPASNAAARALDRRFALAEDLQIIDRSANIAAAARIEKIEQLRIACGGASTTDGVKFRPQGDLEWRSLRAEIAALLNITEHAAEHLLQTGWALHDHLPGTLALFRDGSISERHAHTMAHHTDGLTAEQIEKLEKHALEIAPRLNPARFETRVRMLRQRITNEVAAERHREAAKARHVSVQHVDDQMAWLTAYLPAVEATAILNRLESTATGLRNDPAEERTRNQLMVDTLTELLLTGHATGTHGIIATVHLTVPALTLLGHTTDPAILDGFGPIDIDTARRLTADAPSFTRILTHPDTGALLSLGRTRYRPTRAMRDWLRLRDGTCRAPGCGRHADRCDLDHTTDWAHGGTTDHDNLAHLCRAHHTLKHHTGWELRAGPAPGVMEWVSPLGYIHTTDPFLEYGTPPPEAAIDATPDTDDLEGLPPDPDRDWYETEWQRIIRTAYGASAACTGYGAHPSPEPVEGNRGRALPVVGLGATALLALLDGGALHRLLEFVHQQQLSPEVARAVAGATDHVRRDRHREQLEQQHRYEHEHRRPAAGGERDGGEHEDETQDLRLGCRVHPTERIREPQEPHAGCGGEQRAQQQADGGDHIEHGFEHHGRPSLVRSCFDT
ncbi:uncharacterized protein DUF222 [Diaminobutyricimonas aerilata]|uniref:Uncharacterized protein DUF222 n=1 Tax=Diaminobutyricimonas aerilata TaxID=1162967 RepID=A0A2M9CHG6_9MICO|nr:uncharacterized protein DUF222 [Diaminobutyricimonas aerilata]